MDVEAALFSSLPEPARERLRSVVETRHFAVGEVRFEDLPTRLGIVAVDIETGEEVLLQSGLLWEAIMASMAYPDIYEPVHLNNRFLIDGAVLNPVPVSAVVEMGADMIISSSFSGPEEGQNGKRNGRRRRPMILGTITRSLEIMQSKIGRQSGARADIAIQSVFEEPPGLLDFKRGREFEEVGEQAAERAIPKIRAALPWLA